MAGPGGGPPRRSHTKSRKGCDTCKRRHIRCDENFPQCRNCTKHKIRCPYNDMPVPEDRSVSPDKPDLMWTPEIEVSIEQWKATGVFPFPRLNIFPAPLPQNHSLEDLRLIHHLASICDELADMNASNFTLWTRQIPTILQIGATNSYVMHALLAFSAMHIAFLTDCPLVGNLAYEHRGVAFKGLQKAISSFARETSDAILAASLVLSWQATDWPSWTQLMQGTSSVIDAMEPWRHESQFGDFIAESSTFPTAPPSPSTDHRPSPPRQEDLNALADTLVQLQKVEAHLKASKEDSKVIQQLSVYLKASRKITPSLGVAAQFERLRLLRTWLFWVPITLLKQSKGSPNALLVIAHYYTAALLMERLFPEIGTAYFGSLSVGPVEDIARHLQSMKMVGRDVHTPLALMRFPLETVSEFRFRMGWVQPARTPSIPQFDSPTFFVAEPASLPPTTEQFLPYGDNPAFSYSAESLPMLSAPESVPNSAISPLTLSSPFVSTQYLGIPSPSYGGSGAYSPASSTFEGSIAYSDTDEYVPYDFPHGLPSAAANSTPTMFQTGIGSHGSFGVGFVPPIQTVWI